MPKIKPKIGEPCNGCGICCQTVVCLNGAYLLRLVDTLGDTVDGPCPALILKGERYVCGVVVNPKKYIKGSKYPTAVLSRNFAQLIGGGIGCDNLLDNDTKEEEDKQEALAQRIANDPEWRRKAAIAMRVIHDTDR